MRPVKPPGLREAGIRATVNYVLPSGYIAKGEGGFENTTVSEGRFAVDADGSRVAVIDTGVAAKIRREAG